MHIGGTASVVLGEMSYCQALYMYLNMYVYMYEYW